MENAQEGNFNHLSRVRSVPYRSHMNIPCQAEEWPCFGGPFDGSLIAGVGREWIGRVFESSSVGHLYRRADDDTGLPYWQYAGVVPFRSAQAA